MKKKLRLWFKDIIYEVIRDFCKSVPLIISNRPPNIEDTYEKGTIWQDHRKEKVYVCEKLKAYWKLTSKTLPNSVKKKLYKR